MPTPFYHLALANELLADSGLSADTRDLLIAHRPAFLFGCTAPDVTTLSGQLRESAHFFEVPMLSDRPAHEVMFAAFPDLAHAADLSPEHSAFLAGYVCHLALDQLWIRELFEPVFGPNAAWGDFRERLYLHNILRAWLDAQLLPELPFDTPSELREASPRHWLPFVTDGHLREWRDFLAGQLEPGARNRTVDVFAGRMGKDAAEFHSLLASPAELERRVFSRVSRERLVRFRADGLALSVQRIAEYLPAPVFA